MNHSIFKSKKKKKLNFARMREEKEADFQKKGSSTVCDKARRKIEKTERRNEITVYSEKLRLTEKQRQRR